MREFGEERGSCRGAGPGGSAAGDCGADGIGGGRRDEAGVPWSPPGTVRRVQLAGGPDGVAAGILDAAAGRSLVAVVRDAHRDANTRSLVGALLAARPDTVVVEMGLPFWSPPEGTCYLATYGASRASAQAAAELLGLPAPAGEHPPRTPQTRADGERP
jgi:hypothetical protein